MVDVIQTSTIQDPASTMFVKASDEEAQCPGSRGGGGSRPTENPFSVRGECADHRSLLFSSECARRKNYCKCSRGNTERPQMPGVEREPEL
jgi:hypothetical protein